MAGARPAGDVAPEFARLLLMDFNVYRLQTKYVHDAAQQTPWVRRFKAESAENLGAVSRMARWCRAHNVEPRLWLYFLFRSRAWRAAPQLTDGHLQSEKLLAKYGPQPRLGFFRRHTAEFQLADPRGDAYDPNRDVTESVEALKRQMLAAGAEEECRRQQLTRTLGYHPWSAVCARCPQREQCAIDLEAAVPFSIHAVRAGRLTAAQAELLARRGGRAW